MKKIFTLLVYLFVFQSLTIAPSNNLSLVAQAKINISNLQFLIHTTVDGFLKEAITPKGITLEANLKAEIILNEVKFDQPPLTIECKVIEEVSTIGGMDGLASLEIFDGVAPYNVELLDTNTGIISSLNGKVNFVDLTAGNYSVSVVDAVGDIGLCSFTVREPIVCDFVIGQTATNITCFGGNDGAIALNFTNGIAPYSINWSDSVYDGVQNITALAAGTYQAMVVDSLGCADTIEVVITEPAPLSATIISEDTILCRGELMVLNLEEEYAAYTWSNMATTNSIIIGEEGLYQVTVTDNNGCMAMDSIRVEVVQQDTFREQLFTCDPNNVGDFFIERRNANGCMDIIFRTLILTEVDTLFTEETTCDPTEAGVFSFIIVNNTGCSGLQMKTVKLLRSDTTYLVETSCLPQDTGLVRLVLTNQFGCDSIVETRILLETSDICQIGFNAFADTLCWNETEGTIHIITTFGNPPFTYTIEDIGTNTIDSGIINTIGEEILVNNIQEGTYTVKLRNPNTISASVQQVVFNKHPVVEIAADISDYYGFAISCVGETDGYIQLELSDTQSPYEYNWETGDTTDNLKNIRAGIYEVTVEDVNNCKNTAAFDISAADEITIDVEANTPRCFGDIFGQLVIVGLPNANGPTEYSLDGTLFEPIPTLPFTIDNLEAGEYQLFVQDGNDCQANTNVVIEMANDNEVTLGDPKNLTLGDSLTIRPKANFDIARFEWTATIPLACADCPVIRTTPVQSGEYTLVAYDANDCATTASLTVNLQKEKQVYLPNVFSPNGDGVNDVYQIFTGKSVIRLKLFQIFDYEGRLMYQVNDRAPNDASIGWDGRFNGKKMITGVFVVLADVDLIDGTTQQYTQPMTLVQ